MRCTHPGQVGLTFERWIDLCLPCRITQLEGINFENHLIRLHIWPENCHQLPPLDAIHVTRDLNRISVERSYMHALA
jgi:hypothetical protein